jgi:hypothetical protein
MILWVISLCESSLQKCEFQVHKNIYIILFIVVRPVVCFGEPAHLKSLI